MQNLMVRYWKGQEKRGAPLRDIFAVVSFGGVQPEGYIMGWSSTRKDAAAQIERFSNNGDLRIVKCSPPKPGKSA